ncbi:hypothetical protein [Arenimonas sp.]|uniref:hypothetical protein n=1 Tax=Arenimonas sp. TaxID=1872635 RepID=UPI0035B2F78C
MSWTQAQRAMLSAMGYTLYRPAGASAAVAPVSGADAGPLPEGPLLKALRRAARRDDLAGLPLPPWEQLRADAATKRALWLRLRALRRAR